MKIRDLLEGGGGSGRVAADKRPDKNLWFQRQDLWMEDLHSVHGVDMDMVTTNDDREGDVFVVDPTHKMCYGAWRKDLKQGVAFAKPRPLHLVADPRAKYVRMVDAPVPGTVK